jgi:hypothetical protein
MYLMVFIMKRTTMFFLLVCFGCGHQAKMPIAHISLVNNDSAVEFSGIDASIMGEIGRDTASNVWQNLLPVYRMPADTDMKDYQPIQHGLYQIKDSSVVFTPDTPFAKGHIYFMRYYQFAGGDDTWEIIKGKKKLRGLRYVDLVFKD